MKISPKASVSTLILFSLVSFFSAPTLAAAKTEPESYSKTEVEALLNQQKAEIKQEYMEKQTERFRQFGERIDNRVDKAEDRIRGQIESEIADAKDNLNLWMTYISILFTGAGLVIGCIGIVLPFLIGRKYRDESKELLVKAKTNLEEIEEIATKVKTKEAEMDRISVNVSTGKAITKEEQATIDDMVNDKTIPYESRIRAQALKAHAEKQWELASNLWKVIILSWTEDYSANSNLAHALYELGKSKSGDEADKLFKECYYFCEKTAEQKRDSKILYNWGLALSTQAETKEGEEADSLFKEAFKKYAEAASIESDFADVFSNWGSGLLVQARRQIGKEADRLFKEAYKKCLKAEEIKNGEGAYNLACIESIRGKSDDCRKWLEKCSEHGTLESCEHMKIDTDLDNVRDEKWFNDFMKEVCGED